MVVFESVHNVCGVMCVEKRVNSITLLSLIESPVLGYSLQKRILRSISLQMKLLAEIIVHTGSIFLFKLLFIFFRCQKRTYIRR